jgi:hypothetical protein
MPSKPPPPPPQPPRTPAPHVQAAVARAAQAKLPERPAPPVRPPHPAVPSSARSGPQPAEHVRRALAPVQAKLPAPKPALPPHIQAALAATAGQASREGSQPHPALQPKLRIQGELYAPGDLGKLDKLIPEKVFAEEKRSGGRWHAVRARIAAWLVAPQKITSFTSWQDAVTLAKESAELPYWKGIGDRRAAEQARHQESMRAGERKVEERRALALERKPVEDLKARMLGSAQVGRATSCAADSSATPISWGESGWAWSTHFTEVIGSGAKRTVTTTSPLLNPLVAALNDVVQQPALGRMPWVCGEVEAATKALLKGYRLSDLSFVTSEKHDGAAPRLIKRCAHCEQWAKSIYIE